MKQKLFLISLLTILIISLLCWVLPPHQSDMAYTGFEVFGFFGTVLCGFILVILCIDHLVKRLRKI